MLFDCCLGERYDFDTFTDIMENDKRMEFNSKLIRKFHNLVECPATINKRVGMLEAMESAFSEPIFEYENEEKQILGMKYLLGTWEIILNGLNDVKLHDKCVLYRFIVYIAYRKEFYLENNGFDINKLMVTQSRLPLLRRYIYLLKLTLIEAIIIFKDTPTATPLLFASRILLLCCIRIPSVGEVVYTGLQQSQPPFHMRVPDIRYDIFNDDEFYQNSVLQRNQLSVPDFDLIDDSSNPNSFLNSYPKSHSMSYLPSFVDTLFSDASSDSYSYSSSSSGSSDDYSDGTIFSEESEVPQDYLEDDFEEEQEDGEDEHDDSHDEHDNSHDSHDEHDESHDEHDNFHHEHDDSYDEHDDYHTYHGYHEDSRHYHASHHSSHPNEDGDDEDLEGDREAGLEIDGDAGFSHGRRAVGHSDLNVDRAKRDFRDVINKRVSTPMIDFVFECDPLGDDTNKQNPALFAANRDVLDGLSEIQSSISPTTPAMIDEDMLPPLRVKDYSQVVEQMSIDSALSRSLRSQHDDLQNRFPSLFYWCVISDGAINCESAQWWAHRFLVKDGFLFTFVRCWSDHIHDYRTYLHTPLPFACVPSYFLLLRSFLPALQASLIYQYRCGQMRSHWMSSLYDQNTAGLKASERILVEPSLLNLLIEVLFSQCNAYVFSDVLICCTYLDTWFRFLRIQSLTSAFPIQPIKSYSDTPEIRALQCLQQFLQLELRSPFTSESNIYRRFSINDGFLKLHAEEAFIVSGIAQNEGEALEAWDEVVRQNYVKQVRYDYAINQTIWQLRKRVIQPFLVAESSLVKLPESFDFAFFFGGMKRLLHQEHVMVLKRVLTFIYNNSDLLYGEYRNQFFSYLFTDFYRFFCHWDTNIRSIFHLILIYRCFRTRRSRLPALTSKDILDKLEGDKLREIRNLEMSGKNDQDTIQRLIITHSKWKRRMKLKGEEDGKTVDSVIVRSKSTLGIFDDALEQESDAIDLVLCSQLDSYLLEAIRQINHPEERIVSINLRHYLFLSLADYLSSLQEYERQSKNELVSAPILDPTIMVMEQSINLNE